MGSPTTPLSILPLPPPPPPRVPSLRSGLVIPKRPSYHGGEPRGFRKIRDAKYRPPNSRIPFYEGPHKVPPIFGNPHLGLRGGGGDHVTRGCVCFRLGVSRDPSFAEAIIGDREGPCKPTTMPINPLSPKPFCTLSICMSSKGPFLGQYLRSPSSQGSWQTPFLFRGLHCANLYALNPKTQKPKTQNPKP